MTTAEAPRFSVGLPQILGCQDPGLLTRFAVRAEELGFTGLWTIDNAPGGETGTRPVLDAVHVLTFVAGATASIQLGTAVLVLPRRNPVILAKELATVDQLSRGRLVVGVGAGRDDGTAAALGFPTDRPVSRLVDGVATMRAVWSCDGADDADIVTRARARVHPKPLQQPAPPVWFGAGGPRALQRVAEHADGWIGAGASTLADFEAQSALLDAALAGRGRPAAAFPRAKRVYLGIESTAGRARELLSEALDGLYGTTGLTDRVGIFGEPAACADALAAILTAGATELILTPVYDHERQLEAFADVAVRVGR